jgi:quinol monooxygenase YgiN
MSITVGLLATLEAKPGNEDKVAQLLTEALPVAQNEPGTTVWFALRLGPTTFGVFDAFADEAGREAHLTGLIPQALGANIDLFAGPPDIKPVDILATKLP